ncbi:hypothetical protein Tsp_05803 [Trichinella spiralis]|uniref:hypothetical protein n=1 Tax=Trichinella spiralis TaxID=6334 RepID=UPI0001EFC1C6|nr:hypothetical protein Tsp_05803 [Trichinella spiralis]
MSAVTAGINVSLSAFRQTNVVNDGEELNEKVALTRNVLSSNATRLKARLLLEVRNYIQSTQKCIRELNDRFAGDRNPKSIFLDVSDLKQSSVLLKIMLPLEKQFRFVEHKVLSHAVCVVVNLRDFTVFSVVLQADALKLMILCSKLEFLL